MSFGVVDVDPMLQAAIERLSSKESFYWAFREAEGPEQAVEQDVEIRLNLPAEHLTGPTPDGWTLAHLAGSAVYLRRRQTLTDSEVRRLFVDALTLAHDRNGQFHSWVHGDSVRTHEEAAA